MTIIGSGRGGCGGVKWSSNVFSTTTNPSSNPADVRNRNYYLFYKNETLGPAIDCNLKIRMIRKFI